MFCANYRLFLYNTIFLFDTHTHTHVCVILSGFTLGKLRRLRWCTERKIEFHNRDSHMEFYVRIPTYTTFRVRAACISVWVPIFIQSQKWHPLLCVSFNLEANEKKNACARFKHNKNVVAINSLLFTRFENTGNRIYWISSRLVCNKSRLRHRFMAEIWKTFLHLEWLVIGRVSHVVRNFQFWKLKCLDQSYICVLQLNIRTVYIRNENHWFSVNTCCEIVQFSDPHLVDYDC